MSASSIFTSMREHRRSSAAHGRLTAGTKAQRKCHYRINRSIAIPNLFNRGELLPSLRRDPGAVAVDSAVVKVSGSLSQALRVLRGRGRPCQARLEDAAQAAGHHCATPEAPIAFAAVIKDCRASTLHENIVRLGFELIGPTRAAFPSPEPRRPDQKSLQAEATTCRDPGSVDCPGFFFVAEPAICLLKYRGRVRVMHGQIGGGNSESDGLRSWKQRSPLISKERTGPSSGSIASTPKLKIDFFRRAIVPAR